MSQSTAFFVNGGYGRMLCSIPALEKYHEENPEDDFIIVCEGGTDAYKGHPVLDERAYDVWHKGLFKDKIKDRKIVTTEPYRVWEYYNQKASIAQAFDIQINGKGCRDLPPPTLWLSREELLIGRKIVNDVKEKLAKDKVMVIQPFGRGIQHIDGAFVDPTGRSIEFRNLKNLIKKAQENGYAIILMAEMAIDFSKYKLKDELAMPEGLGLRQWAAVIKYSSHLLCCDSVAQHFSYITQTPTTVIMGPTFPVNVSYPDCDYFNIVDLGMNDRLYDPIRIMPDEFTSRNNENIMGMTDEIEDFVMDRILGKPEDDD